MNKVIPYFQQRYVKPKEDRIDHYRPQGEEFDKAYTYDVKSRTDEISRRQLTSEKITVDQQDATRVEKTEQPKYPKDLDVGRIVIEEIPEEREETPTDERVRQQGRPKSTEITVTQREVKEYPKSYVSEGVIKVGKLDVTDVEKDVIEGTKLEQRIKTLEDRVDGTRKVIKAFIS